MLFLDINTDKQGEMDARKNDYMADESHFNRSAARM